MLEQVEPDMHRSELLEALALLVAFRRRLKPAMLLTHMKAEKYWLVASM